MSAKCVYMCRLRNKSTKATISSIACISCCNRIHLIQCAKLSFKITINKKKVKYSICVESDNNVIEELLRKSFE